MKKYSMFFAKPDFYNIIKYVGGAWNDSKIRPLVCVLKIDNTNIYYAIPVGNWKHRDEAAQKRILSFINSDPHGIQSCFYHLGKTTVRSIFFVSDVVPITDKYIDSFYLGYNNKTYIISNNKLKSELTRKLKRILRQENVHPNYFRQHITDIKNYLLDEIECDKKNSPCKMNDTVHESIPANIEQTNSDESV